MQAGRADLIGHGCDCLIPSNPPREAIEARRRRANDPDHYHTVGNPARAESPRSGGRGRSGMASPSPVARVDDSTRKNKLTPIGRRFRWSGQGLVTNTL